MSKILDAECENGIVQVEGYEVTATILSEGVKASTGKALVEGDEVAYITSNATDIKDLIIKIGEALDKTIAALNVCNSGLTSAGAATAAIAELSAVKAELVLQKDNLK